MRISVTASIHILASREKIWEYITVAENFPKYFLGWGPIPGVKNITIITGETGITAGMKQRVLTNDGRLVEEHFKTVRKPEYFDYEVVSGFGAPLKFVVRKGGASWNIAKDNIGNTLTWSHNYDLTSWLMYPVGLLFIKFFFKNAMAAALQQIKKQLEV
jgi:hypothetical protein